MYKLIKKLEYGGDEFYKVRVNVYEDGPILKTNSRLVNKATNKRRGPIHKDLYGHISLEDIIESFDRNFKQN